MNNNSEYPLRSFANDFSTVAANTRAYLAELELILGRPEFSGWDYGVDVLAGTLVQLFPSKVMDKSPSDGGEWRPAFDVLASARAIARAVGGKWVRRGEDWHCEATTPSGQRLSVILHHVEPAMAPEAIEV